jgi:glycosyltransferase involved in cell wall biosynthesis
MNRLQPLISILIPVYNDEHIIRCLNSVCKQTYKNIEIIIVDDGSNKNITNSFAYFQNTHLNNKIIVIHNATNEGVGPSRNKLLSLYSGEGFIFMDSDDEFYNENSIMLLYEKSENLQKDVTIGHSHFVGTYRKDGVLPLTK